MGRRELNLCAGVAAILLIMAALWRFSFYTKDTRVFFEMTFQMAVVLLLAVLIWDRVNKWVGLFLVLSVVSAFYPMLSRHSVATLCNVFIGCVWFYLLYENANLSFLYDAMCVIALANVAFLVLQYFNIDPLWVCRAGSPANHRVGLMSNPNEVSALLAFCFPAFLRARWKWLIPIVIAGLILAHSFSGILAVGAGVIVYFATTKNLLVSTAIVLIGGFLFFFCVDKPEIGSRIRISKLGLGLSLQHPILGAGLGHWKGIVPAIEKKQGITGDYTAQAHNEYLQGFFEMGIGFLVIVTGYFVSIVRRFKKENIIPIVAVVIIAVNCIAFFPFHIATTALIAVSWLSMMEIGFRNEGF